MEQDAQQPSRRHPNAFASHSSPTCTSARPSSGISWSAWWTQPTASRPDLIALTGDVADGFPPALRDDVAPLAGLVAPHGKYFVTGNHEYYWDAAGGCASCRDSASAPRERASRDPAGAGRIVLAGVTDLSSGGLPGTPPIRWRRSPEAPKSDVRVLLRTQRTARSRARSPGTICSCRDTRKAGSTFPFNLLVRLSSRLSRTPTGWRRCGLYVSRGTGFWGRRCACARPPRYAHSAHARVSGGRPPTRTGAAWR